MGWIADNSSAAGGVRRLSVCLFGPPKTGKTTIACSGEKVLLIEFDPDGEMTSTLDGRGDITVVKPKSANDMNSLMKDVKMAAKSYSWVVLDTLTSLFQMLGGKNLNDALQQGGDTRREYMRLGQGISELIHDMHQLPCHLVFTAQLRAQDDSEVTPQAGQFRWTPELSPMIYRKALYPSCNIIGRTYKSASGKYMVSFDDGATSPAGSRFNIDPPKRENFSLGELLKELTK